MESQPQNSEFRINLENFHPCIYKQMEIVWILVSFVFKTGYIGLSMESQPQNPEFSINPENFHPCINKQIGKQCGS